MEHECSNCKRRIQLNIHRVESIVVLLNFGAVVVLAGFAYWFQSRNLVLTTLGVVMAGALMLPLLEKTWLRHWPRYVTIEPKAEK